MSIPDAFHGTDDFEHDVLVVGGGLAGLAAAVALHHSGRKVRVIESRTRLGGRASSFPDPETGAEIDNCQHVALGCCGNFRTFCRLTGLERFVREESALHFVGPSAQPRRFAAVRLPAPLHLLPAFVALEGLTFRDRWRLVWGLRALCRWRPSNTPEPTFDVWLRSARQSDAAVRQFWEVVLVSALSESLDRITLSHGRKVFVESFLSDRDGWKVLIPTAPLSRFYGAELFAALDPEHLRVDLNTSVRCVTTSAGSDGEELVTGVELRDGRQIAASQVILAIPQHRIADVLPDSLAESEAVRRAAAMETAPITSVHLKFDREITPLPHAVLTGRLSQWVFNRQRISDGGDDSDAGLVQVVISASGELLGRSREAITKAVVAELRECFPESRAARLLASRVVTEKRAVFSVLPDIESRRLPQRTAVRGLTLCGDWTQTGWPATMEGAIKSGFLAADMVLAGDADAISYVTPDVRPSRLSRLLLGLKR